MHAAAAIEVSWGNAVYNTCYVILISFRAFLFQYVCTSGTNEHVDIIARRKEKKRKKKCEFD